MIFVYGKRRKKPMPNVIDLFCGVGGFSLGAARAGFNLIGAIDWDRHAMQMHKLNFPLVPHLQEDILQLNGADIKTRLDIKGDIDGIIGGPPCQGFSRMGHQNVEDTRNTLFNKFFELVNQLQPKFFLAENVLGILDEQNRPIITEALNHVRNDYIILNPVILRASDYGVPTTRTRVFFCGYQRDRMNAIEQESLKMLQDTGVVTVTDALYGLPEIIRDDWHADPSGWLEVPTIDKQSFFYDRIRGHIPNGVGDDIAIRRMHNHQVSGNQGTIHSDSVRARYAALLPGGADAISKSRRLEPNGFCHTIRAGTGPEHGSFQAVRPIHPTQPRVITPREAARLQSFPDWFQFYPTKWHSFRQIGNSVCPVLAEKVLSVIKNNIS